MSTEAARAVEAILMVAQEPVDPHLLAQLLEIAPAKVEEVCTGLQQEYEQQERGFVLVKVAGGYRLQSHADLAPYVERFALEGQSARLSSAALETLAIVAYKQPLSRAQVAAIRGVNVDGVMRTLQQRGYVTEVGRDTGPGQATLFGTSQEFLERMGLDRIEDLPPIADLFPSAEIMEALELTLRAEPVAPADGATTDSAPVPADADPTAEREAASEPEADEAAQAASSDTQDDGAQGDGGHDEGGHDDADLEATKALLGTIDLGAIDLTDDDDLPEPEPPAWAVDPPAADEPTAADLDVDLDGDGQADLTAEP